MIDEAADHVLPQEGDLVTLKALQIPPVNIGIPGGPFVPVAVDALWEMFQAIEVLNKQGLRNAAINLALFGARFMASALRQEGTLPPGLDVAILKNAIEAIEQYHRGKTRKEMVIAFTYAYLRERKLTREDAAKIATALLPEEGPFTTEAWRKAVDRWAAARHQPKVEQRRRKKEVKR
jgi:hypothetical protein